MNWFTALAIREGAWVRAHPLLALYMVVWPVVVALVAIWTGE